MARTDEAWVQDILSAIDDIRGDTAGLDFAGFAAKPTIVRSVPRWVRPRSPLAGLGQTQVFVAKTSFAVILVSNDMVESSRMLIQSKSHACLD